MIRLVLAATVASLATAHQAEADLPYTLGKPTLYGSGCPRDTAAVVASLDSKTISVLFSEFASTIFRVNANVIAQKIAATNGDVQIAIGSADSKFGGFRYKIEVKRC